MTANTNLPKLEGSEKQIAWAESIRAQLISTVTPEQLQEVVQYADHPETAPDERCAAIAKGVAAAIRTTSAKVWIDNRHATTLPMYARAVRRRS